MTLVQNHQRQSNGNNTPSLIGVLSILIFASSCVFFKPVNSTTGNNNPDFPKDLEGPKKVDPNTGEVVYNQQLDVDMDTIQWKDATKSSPVIISDTEMIYNNEVKDPNSFNTGMNMAFFLPFNTSKFNRMDGKIPAASKDAIHYHNGAIMALDALKEKNILVDASFYDTEANAAKLKANLSSNRNLSKADLLIGPFKSSCTKELAEFAKKNKQPLVSPKTMSTNITDSNPYYLQMNPSVKSHCEALMKHALQNFKPEQIVVIGRASESAEMEMMKYCVDYFNSKKAEGDTSYIKEFIITDKTPGYTEVDVLPMIHKSLPSAIIIPSYKEEAFVYEMLNKIRINQEGRNVSIYGLPQWKTKFTNISPSMYESLNVHITSANYIDLFDPEIKKWREEYFLQFSMIPDDEAFLAYTTVMYFGKLFSVHGPDFHFMLETQPDDNFITKYELEKVMTPILQFQDDFSYMPVSRFENKYLHILKFHDHFFQPADKIMKVDLINDGLEIEEGY
jgi:hypothetical protein